MTGFEDITIEKVGGAAAMIYATGYMIRQISNLISNARAVKGQIERRESAPEFCCPLSKINPETGIKEWSSFRQDFHEFKKWQKGRVDP